MQHFEYAALDAIAMASLIRGGDVSSSEFVDAAIARLDAVNETLNVVVHRLDQDARTAAQGPLPDGPFRGVPFLVKDMDGQLAGVPCTYSSRSMADYVAPYDSELFARYRRSGVVFLGTTNCPEFGIFGVTESEFRGPARNPWDISFTPGGSSGGSAAAVAAGIVPVAHGGDGGGSIRIPASCNGLFGLMPSRGRTPMGPDDGEGWHGLVRRHVISRSVRDSAAFLDFTQGGDVGAPYAAPPDGKFQAALRRRPKRLRIGWSGASILGNSTDPDCAAAVDSAVRLLDDLGHDLIEIGLPIDSDELAHAYITIVAASVGQLVEATREKSGKSPRAEDFEAATWFLRQASDVITARELEAARGAIARATREVGMLFNSSIDVHCTAVMPYPPVRVGDTAPSAVDRVALRALRALPIQLGPAVRMALDGLAGPRLEKAANTQLWNMTGQPAMSVPLYWNDQGLPIGVQFASAFGSEATLFSLAGQLERARPWVPRLLAGPLLRAF